jgi:hypothetical protein
LGAGLASRRSGHHRSGAESCFSGQHCWQDLPGITAAARAAAAIPPGETPQFGAPSPITEVRELLDALGQLTGGVAYDFNNILTVITGTIEILADSVSDRPKLIATAQLVREAAERGSEPAGCWRSRASNLSSRAKPTLTP